MTDAPMEKLVITDEMTGSRHDFAKGWAWRTVEEEECRKRMEPLKGAVDPSTHRNYRSIFERD